MANPPTSGRSLVTERAVRDLVRTATLGSYGVTGFAAGPIGRIVERLGLGQPGLTVHLEDGIRVELDLTVALGVPVAEVARQLDSAIRYAVQRALDRDVAHIVIHVDGLQIPPGGGDPLETGGRRPRATRGRRGPRAAARVDHDSDVA